MTHGLTDKSLANRSKVEMTKGHKYDIIIILGGFKWPLESISVVVRSDALQDICYVFT